MSLSNQSNVGNSLENSKAVSTSTKVIEVMVLVNSAQRILVKVVGHVIYFCVRHKTLIAY